MFQTQENTVCQKLVVLGRLYTSEDTIHIFSVSLKDKIFVKKQTLLIYSQLIPQLLIFAIYLQLILQLGIQKLVQK